MPIRPMILVTPIAGLLLTVLPVDAGFDFKICPNGDCITKASLVEATGVIDPLFLPETINAFGWSLSTDEVLQPIAVELHAPYDGFEVEFFALQLDDNGFGAQVAFSGEVDIDFDTPMLRITYLVLGEPEFGQVADFFFEDGAGGGDFPIVNFVESEGVAQDLEFVAGSMILEVAPFLRGDINGDSLVNLADTIWLLNEFFQGGPDSPCMAAGDFNDDGLVDLADGVAILDYRFLDGPAPAAPYPACGFDPTGDFLECGPVCP